MDETRTSPLLLPLGHGARHLKPANKSLSALSLTTRLRPLMVIDLNQSMRGRAMPAAEITAGITSVRAAYDLTKAMIASRDAKILANGARDLQMLLGEAVGKFLEAQQAQMAQLDEIASLKAEIAKFRDWETEKQRYELKNIGAGAFAQMLKPSARGVEPPHWLCPTCFENSNKSYFQYSTQSGFGSVYRCKGCDGHITTNNEPTWL
jgi:hypothetical protein